MTDVNLQKLRLYFSVGMTDAQACYFCVISESLLYEYQIENPDFLEVKGILKDSISGQGLSSSQRFALKLSPTVNNINHHPHK